MNLVGLPLAPSVLPGLALAVVVGDPAVLPLLCAAILPAWLMVTGRRETLIAPSAIPKEKTA